MINTEKRDHIRGMLWGLIVGDCRAPVTSGIRKLRQKLSAPPAQRYTYR